MKSAAVVDSSGWLEYLADTPRAKLFAPAIEDEAHLIVPVVSLYEVFKKVLRERGEAKAFEAASAMQSGRVIDLDVSLALDVPRGFGAWKRGTESPSGTRSVRC